MLVDVIGLRGMVESLEEWSGLGKWFEMLLGLRLPFGISGFVIIS